MSVRIIVSLLAVLAIGAGAGVVIGGDGDDGTTTAVTGTTTATAPEDDPFKPGARFSEPPAVRSRNGKLSATLVAENGIVEVNGPDGVPVAGTQTYAVEGIGERGILGPTLHVKPGERVELTLDNRLTVPQDAPPKTPNCAETGEHEPGHAATGEPGDSQFTNVHFHGLHVTPRERSPFGDTVLVDLPNGKSRFGFDIPADHDQGTFWYHAHLHECTDDQVSRGLAGLLLIGDSRKDLPARFANIETRSLALKDLQVVPATEEGADWKVDPGHTWTQPTHRTVNGLVEPKMSIRPGETQLWRLANVSAGIWYQVALVEPSDDEARDELTVVAQDGNSLLRPEQESTLLIPPGARFDVLVQGPESGSRVLKTFPFDQGFRTFPEETLATLEVRGDPATPIAAPDKLAPPPQRFPAKRGPTRRFAFDIDLRTNQNTIDTPPKSFLLNINGEEFDPDIPGAIPTLGTTERWILYNKSEEWHPFHIHQDDFKVVKSSPGGQPQLQGDHDVVGLPPGTPAKPSVTEIEMPFTDFEGNFVFHCHILDHEDAGMMSLVELRKSR